MELYIRELNETDYDDILVDWWLQWGWVPPQRDFLPNNGKGGIIIYDDETPVCAGFMYLTNSKVAWVMMAVEPAATLVEAADLTIVSEVWRPIRLALMAPAGASLRTVRTAESHPIALRQCPAALAALGLTPVEAFDTAGAARAVAEAGDVTRAAVAPAGAAEVYDLSILRNDIQDSESNRTRFVLLSIRTA